MLFNSLSFLIFAAGFFLLWPAARARRSVRYAFLVVAAAVFYGWWDWRFLFLLFGTGVADYGLALGMAARPRWRHALFGASLALNLGSLAIFKYTGFLVESLGSALGRPELATRLHEALPQFLWLLPIGISFYTFQALSYTIEVHDGRLRPTRNVLHYLAFKSLFPLLLAGPIMRAAELLPQLEQSRRPTATDRWEGLKLIVFGFFQKMVIADGLGQYVNVAFAGRTPADSCLYWWIIVVAYAIQLYCDFGGYSSIASGLGRWMGYDLTLNFRHPYLATSISEFWTRWHISLSGWIWRYLFTPLTYAFLRLVGRLNLPTVEQEMRLAYPAAAMCAMVLCGLWHGAGVTFLVWGALHGLFLSLERLTNAPKRLKRLPRGRDLAMLVMLLQVGIAWVFFRASTLGQAVTILRRLFGFSGGFASVYAEMGGAAMLNVAVLLAMGIGREAWQRHEVGARLPLSPTLRLRLETASVALLIPASIYLRGVGARFIYFQF